MRNRIARFMYGRYGNDQLGNFLFGLYLVVFVVQFLFRKSPVGLVLMYLGYGLVILYFFRVLSRNIYKRSAENQKFLRAFRPVKNYVHYLKMKWKERGGSKKLYRCSKCQQIIRVPRGKGKIAITCPKCHFEFIKKT
ncbi:MAG: hypothetical protein K6G62_03425 [Eubacterium sp.]|nr:hypothetical protein [Eubacterium sp.]